MDELLYQQYVRLKETGRKREASDVLAAFIASFRTHEEKRAWTRVFLEAGDFGHKIRHEIYEHLVFPVLLEGYRRQEAWSLLWLARTTQNLYRSPELHAQIDNETRIRLLKKVYAIQPSEEVRASLLGQYLDGFRYCEHEWPMGILYGVDGASVEECAELLDEVAYARTLDSGIHEPFLSRFEARIVEYRQRLERLDKTELVSD